MTTDALRTMAAEQTAEARTSRFLDADNTLIDIATAMNLLETRPASLATVFGYASDRGARFGQSPAGALCILVERGELQLFKRHAGSSEWYPCSNETFLLVQIEGRTLGVVPGDDNSPITTPVAVKLAHVLGALDAADDVARYREAQRQERERAQEARRQRVAAFQAAHDAERRANQAVYQHTERARQEAMERRRGLAKLELEAKLRSNDPDARAALTAAHNEDLQAQQAAEREAQQLKQALEDARERYRLAQIDMARMG